MIQRFLPVFLQLFVLFSFASLLGYKSDQSNAHQTLAKLNLPDGSVLVSDDHQGTIYRIT